MVRVPYLVILNEYKPSIKLKIKISYVHCYDHCFNLALVDSVYEKTNSSSNLKNNRCIFNFFGTIQFIYSFIKESFTRYAILEKIIASFSQKFVTLKSLSTTRWACRAGAVILFKNHYASILTAFKEICEKSNVPEMRA